VVDDKPEPKDPIERALREKLAKAEKRNDAHSVAGSLEALARHLITRPRFHKPEEAVTLAERAVALRRQQTPELYLGEALVQFGNCCVEAGQLERAVIAYREAIPILEGRPSPHVRFIESVKQRCDALAWQSWLAAPDDAACPSPPPQPTLKTRRVSGHDNLALAIRNALVKTGQLQMREIARDEDDDTFDTGVFRALVALPVAAEALASIQTLSWQGGEPLQHIVWPQWDGESDEFDVQSLAGIEQLTGLECLDLLNCDLVDLSPLATLPKLSKLSLHGGFVDALEPLLHCPALKVIDIRTLGYERNPTNMAVIKRLLRSGVELTHTLIPPTL
jgi:hypothetical protein